MSPEEKYFISSLWQTHHQFMRNRISHLGVRHSDVDDVLMDCFVNLIKVRKTLQELNSEELRAYIAISVRNRCLRWHYINNKVSEVALEDDTIDAFNRSQLIEDELITRMETEHQTALLLDALTDRDKLLLFGHFIEGQTDGELADQLRCKKTSVRSLLCRAKKNARSILLNEEGGGSNGRAQTPVASEF